MYLRESASVGGVEREGEFKSDSMLSTEADMGLHPTILRT